MSERHPRNGKVNGAQPRAPSPLTLARDAGLDVAATLRGRAILITGATGFVGKVTLSMLLHRYPEIGKVFVLVRPGTGGTAEARFFGKVAPSSPFDPLREQHGPACEAFLRDRCVPLAGDVSDPLFGLGEGELARLDGLAAVVNCAGLVDFNPSLELAVNVNVLGARHAADVCLRTGAALVHVSTCFVAGNRSGVVFEDEELQGYFPRREGVEGRPTAPVLDARDFDLERELADCARRIARVREDAEDVALLSELRERAQERLRGEGRAGDERAQRLAVGREKRLWVSQRLVELGMDRARHWGWPNTYTYTKSLGEQAIARSGIRYAIVRPSIVETALRYPFPGWNEGFTTSAPLAFLGLKGQRVYPMGERAILDIVPVDLVAAGTIAVTAQAIAGQQRRVYHLASSDANPLYVRRALALVGLYRRRFYKRREEGSRALNALRARFEPYSVSRRHYEAFSAPAFRRLARAASELLRTEGPAWGAPRVSALAGRAADALDELQSKLAGVEQLFELFMPFVWENRYVFHCGNVRELCARLSPADRARLPWDPEQIEWRDYWLDVHMKGLEAWVFPGLEEESKKKVHAVKQHRDLLELFQAACETHRRRVALRMEGARKERFTYGELRAFAERVAGALAARGVRPGDRVLLAAENRPEWAAAFFGVLRAGAVAVPVDAQLSADELANLARSAGARLAVLSEAVLERLPALMARWEAEGGPVPLLLADAMAGDPACAPAVRAPQPDDVASLIFTSGTTGTPKGVLLTHRNFTSLVTKLSTLFDLRPGDALLSVLPLHHTFEFTCGLLVPLSRGAEIEYLDELTADTLGDALERGRVTAMIGVPALWALLHRRITQELSARPGAVEAAAKALMGANASLRDRFGVNLGKALFWPVHRRMGGRLRILVSGGSALAPEVQRAFHELGFDLFEGYGLTEAAPVLAVSTPEDGASPGTVGRPLPGIELRIDAPDAGGVGEVLARGPNVMAGYWKAGSEQPEVDRELTAQVLEGGWLRTGDLGRLDGEGRLTLVGRKKDVIIDADGKNVHPDEVEERYRSDDLVKELSVVGLGDGTAEKVAMLVVPNWNGRDRPEVRRLLEEHVRRVTAALPFHQRVKCWHVTDRELPRTSTRKVKRAWVVEELRRLEASGQQGARVRAAARDGRGDGWLLDLVAEVSRRPRESVTHASLLAADLGFDSLMLTELAAALEEAGVAPAATEDLHRLETVGELSRAVLSATHRDEAEPRPARPPAPVEERDVELPAPLAALGRRLLGAGQRLLYRDLYRTTVRGKAFIPRDRNFLVVANHSSHLDMGLVKVALGDEGEKLAALAAKDYFFDTTAKRAYFENFTNLVPMERAGSVRKSLRSAVEVLRRGMNLLIFPEGTRSRDGGMSEFKPTAGYLALQCGVDTLPLYIRGTHRALPPGQLVPRSAELEVVIGQPIPVDELRRRTGHLSKGEAHKEATRIMEEAVRRLGGLTTRPGTSEPAPLPNPLPAVRGEGESHPTATPSPQPSPPAGERESSLAPGTSQVNPLVPV
ncbi:MAG TPA: AMP-binding protein, partial [Anaeromyxobacteraceae bacterium]|nr:AMP-binding protein [Anaeromyxobacteraceae bacterium]